MIARNIFSNWAALLLTALLSLILTPVLIHSLGNFYFGLWMLVGSVVGHYGLLDMGMRAGLFRFAARFRGACERKALNQTLVSAVAVAAGIAIVVLALTVVLILLLPGFFRLGPAERTTFRWVLLLLGAGTAFMFPARMLGTYLSSMQRFDLYSLGEISTNALRTALIVFVLYLGYSIVGVSAITLLSGVVLLALYALMVRRADPEVQLDPKLFDWSRVRELASFSMYAFAASLGDYLRFSTDNMVISRVLMVEMVTPFSIPSRIVQYVQQMIVALGAPINARLNELDGQGKLEEMRHLFLRATRLTTVLTTMACVLLLVHGSGLIRFWVGDLPNAYPVMTILVIGAWAELSQHPTLLVMLSRSRHRTLAALTMVEGLVNLGLSVYWARVFGRADMAHGLIGVALGTTVPMVVIRMFVQPAFALRALEMTLGRYLREALLRPAILGAILYGV